MHDLTSTDHPKRDLRQAPRGFEDEVETVQRGGLANEENVEIRLTLPSGSEETFLCPQVTDRYFVESCQLAHEIRIRLGVRHYKIGSPKSCPVEAAKSFRRERTVAEPLAIFNEGVVQRHHCVEDDRSTVPLCAPKIEVSGIAHYHCIDIRWDPRPCETKLSSR
jgi:hypothetical protein